MTDRPTPKREYPAEQPAKSRLPAWVLAYFRAETGSRGDRDRFDNRWQRMIEEQSFWERLS